MGLSVKLLYRLCSAGMMLRNVKVTGRGTAHNYPKMILTYLLILDYWRTTGYMAVDMMRAGMPIVNEALGEGTFSLLGKAVLGDSCKSDFQHMRKLYQMLPIYRDVKDDIQEQQGRNNTFNWHHTIATNDQAVVLTGVFFNRLIRGVCDGTYRSYDGDPECYLSQRHASQHLTEDYVALVYNENVVDDLDVMFTSISRSTRSNFMQGNDDIWEISSGDSSASEDDTKVSDIYGDDAGEDQVFGAPWVGCQIGRLAVSSANFPGTGHGIAVYHIESVNPLVDEEKDEYRSFMGRQLHCTVMNSSASCVRSGVWTRHRNVLPSEQVFDWEVIIYFDALTDNKLPEDVALIIEEHASQQRVFETI